MADESTAIALDPKFAPGAEQARQNVAVGISVTMTLIGMMCVVLRVSTRAFIVGNMGVEDWTMIAAAVLTLVFLIQLLVSAKDYGMGFSSSSVTMSQMVESSKMGLAVIIVYKSIVTLIKVSILLIYLRLSVNKTFERLCRGSIYLLLTYQFIVIIVVPAQCTPLRKVWDFTGQVPGHCINTTIFYYITSAFHIAMDIWILLLPYKLIISIPRPLRERLAVYSVFGLGLFSTICAIVRFNYLVVVTHSKDPFYDSLSINTWSVIEVNVGILCASLPTLRPLFSQAQRDRTREALHLTRKKSARSSKRGGILNAKEMFITITAMSFRSGKTSTYDDEEFDLHEEHPPPVPPKDEKSAAKVSYPDMAYRKI